MARPARSWTTSSRAVDREARTWRPRPCRAAAPGAEQADAQPPLYTASPRPYRGLEELDGRHHHLRPDLLPAAEGRQSGLRGAKGGRQAGRRAHLARRLHALRFGILRRRDVPARADRESLRPESVTYVVGMNCHPGDRNRPKWCGVPNGIRTRVLALKVRNRGILRINDLPRVCRASSVESSR